MSTRLRPALWVGMGAVLGMLGSATWLSAQSGTRAAAPRVYSGADAGFRVESMRGETPVVVPVVKINGEWVEVDLGGGGIRKLTQ